jgi:hypothetical protein
MPRLIDYAGRFEFIRQAAFAVVRDEGVETLSRRRVAAELGTSVNTIRRSVAGWVDLVRLAADHVVSRRRVGRFNRRTEDPLEAVEILVSSLMPQDRSHLDEELVWLKLVAACALRPSGLEPPGTVRRDFGIAQRGYDAESAVHAGPTLSPAHAGTSPTSQQETEPDSGAGVERAREDRASALAGFVQERDEDLTFTVGRVLDLLHVPEPRQDVAGTMIALIEGLTLSACLGRMSAEQATELAVAHALSLATADDRAA